MNAIPTQAPMPAPMPYLVDGPSYTPSQAAGTGTAQVFKLSSNESAVGPSPRVLQTIRDAAATQHLYPDPDGARLAHAIAARHGLDPTRIITAPGSDAIINWIIQGWASNGDEVVYSAHGFQSYRIRTSSRGAVPVAAPERALRADVPALLAAVTPRTRILFIANPNNPTGTYLDSDELAVLRARLRSDILMVVDEAYFEYVDAPDYASALALVRDDSPNVIVTRTFSKFFGLAGQRAGLPLGCEVFIGRWWHDAPWPMARKASNKALIPRRSRLLRWLSALSQVTSCSLYGSSTLAAVSRTGYWGSTISGSLSHLVAVFLEIPSLRLAWRADRPSRKTRRRNLLKVPTLITPGHPCSKNKQDRPMKWLKFGCKFPSKWGCS